MLNATVGVRRLLVRFRPVPTRRPTHRLSDRRRRASALAEGVTSRLAILANPARLSWVGASARLALSTSIAVSSRAVVSARTAVSARWAASGGRDRAAHAAGLAAARFAIALRRISDGPAVGPRPPAVSGAHPIRRPESIANLSDGERGSATGQLMLSRVRRRRRCRALSGRWRGRSWRIRPGRTRRRGEAVRPRRRRRRLLLRGDDSSRDNECHGKRQNDEFPHRSPSILFGLVLACTPYTS